MTARIPHKRDGGNPRFRAKADLEKKGFNGLNHDYYMLYTFDTAQSRQYTGLPSLIRGKNIAPDFLTWETLMAKK